MLDRDLGSSGDGIILTDSVDPQRQLRDVLQRAEAATPEERVGILKSDLSPRPVSVKKKQNIYQVGELAHPRPLGPYLYGLFLVPSEGIIYLRTHPQGYETWQPEEEVLTRMMEKAETRGAISLRQGEVYVNWSDVMERNVRGTGVKGSDQALRAVVGAHFEDYEMYSIDRSEIHNREIQDRTRRF